jgi:hypothetical protein
MDAEYFHSQALRCYRLARQCFELSVAEELNELGDELQAKARELDNGHSRVSAHTAIHAGN